MSDNSAVIRQLSTYAKLAELHELNPFRYKAFANAAFNLRKVRTPFQEMSDEDLSALPGVGKGVLLAIRTIALAGSFPELEGLLEKTPEGIVRMLGIKGLGPKKVRDIWRNMGIEDPGELLDACRENRLVQLPGFGFKTQAEILQALEFAHAASGSMHFARAEPMANAILQWMNQKFPEEKHALCGALRLQSEVINRFDLLTTVSTETIQTKLPEAGMQFIGLHDSGLEALSNEGMPVLFHICNSPEFVRRLFETTGPDYHIVELGYTENSVFNDEATFYDSLDLHYVPPECRENPEVIGFAKIGLDDLVSDADICGVLHNHSTWSDGLNTIEEMALACRDAGYSYFGICDHSRSAAYAGGLSIERVLAQREEIEKLNARLHPFRIVSGIESDILSDGSLDYPDEILAGFDMVVASVHSNLNMTKEKATGRLIKAIENPFTTILGHPTGRLLLIRRGYEIDHAKVIDACSANGVAIEINAHPYRLDIDWRWLTYAMEKEVMISINPDAHEKSGIGDMRYGVIAARKGLLQRPYCLNALPSEAFLNYLANRKRLAKA